MKQLHGGLLLVAPLLVTACGEGPTEVEAPQPAMQQSLHVAGYTPLQNHIAQLLESKAARGLPVPKVSFEFTSAEGTSLAELRSKEHTAGKSYSFVAKTIIRYTGPSDAGLAEWPAFALSASQSEKLHVTNAEIRDRYVAKKEKANPGFWARHEFGREPRTYTVTETETVTYPAAPPARALTAALSASEPSNAVSQQDLVFGFSINLPIIKASRSFGIDDVEDLEFSFEARWDFGIRLPVAGSLGSIEPMVEGSVYSPTSTMRGLNYSAAQYSAVGLPAEGGNEVFFSFLEQGCVEFSGIIDSGKQCAGPDIERHNDFITPFGPDASVPFPTVNLTILDYGIAGIDLKIPTRVGSDKITGDWSVLGGATGSGHVEYSDPATPEMLSSVRAVDGPGTALLSVDGLLYHFTHFTVSPSLRLWVDVEIPIPLAPDIDWEDSWSVDLGTYDLSDFIDHDFIDSNGASVGLHHNETYTGPTRLTMNLSVANVAPTAAIAVAGGHKYNFNGVPTIVGNTGEAFEFTGRSHDPGRDGLTLSWDWDDGAPAPDLSTNYPLISATGPNDATDTRTHIFDRSCLYQVTLKSVDDDNAAGEDHSWVLVTGASGGPAGLDGYWQHQLGRNGGDLLDAPTINCYLAIVGRVSTIFNEVRAASTMADAFSVIGVSQNAGSEIDKLDREILVAWLNFANGAIGYTQMVDSNGDGISDTPFFQVMQIAEDVRRSPLSTPNMVRGQIQIVHLLSVGARR